MSELNFKTNVVIEMVRVLKTKNGSILKVAPEGPASLNYSVELETRPWGIKSIDLRVPDQMLIFNIEYYDELDNEALLMTANVQIENVVVEGAGDYNCLFPRTLKLTLIDPVIDYEKKELLAKAAATLSTEI